MNHIALAAAIILTTPVFSAEDAPDLPTLTSRAEGGDAAAQAALAARFREGKGVPKDELLGLKWAHRATKGIIDITKTERPADAVTLVGPDGHDLVPESAQPTKWVFADGILTASPMWDSVVTKDAYGDFRMHVEFNVNDAKDAKDREANGNSGVYIQKRYELQIHNSFGIPEAEYTHSYGGSIYRQKKPDQFLSKKAGEWQTYDIVFRAARFDGDKKSENARITVYHNGGLIHDDYAITGKTGAGEKEGPEPRPIKLQGHHNPVQFRNVWIQKLTLNGTANSNQ